MAQLIDGKAISKQIKDELKEQVAELSAKGVKICLAVIQVGMIRHLPYMSAIRKRHVPISALILCLMSFRKRQRRKNC